MSVKTFEGVVENGRIRLAGNVHLPENAKVYVLIPNGAATPPAFVGSPRLVNPEEASAFKKEVIKETPNAGV